MKYIFYKALIVSLSFFFSIIFIEQSSKIVIEKFIKDNDSFDYNKYILKWLFSKNLFFNFFIYSEWRLNKKIDFYILNFRYINKYILY